MTGKKKLYVKKSIAIGALGAALIAAAPHIDGDASGFGNLLRQLDSSAAAARTDSATTNRQSIQKLVVEEAMDNGTVPPALALAVAQVESDFQARVKSHAGARGVMQIMPATAWGEYRVRAEQLWVPQTNIRIGIAFLTQLYRTYGNRWDLALSHYNGGTLDKVGGRYVAHSYTRDYVRKVMRKWRHYQRNNLVARLAVPKTPTHERFQSDRSFYVAMKRDDDPSERLQARRDASRAHDYFLLEDPKGDKNWRDYLKVADRWLKRGNDGSDKTAEIAQENKAQRDPVAAGTYRQAPSVIIDGRPGNRFRHDPAGPRPGYRFR